MIPHITYNYFLFYIFFLVHVITCRFSASRHYCNIIEQLSCGQSVEHCIMYNFGVNTHFRLARYRSRAITLADDDSGRRTLGGRVVSVTNVHPLAAAASVSPLMTEDGDVEGSVDCFAAVTNLTEDTFQSSRDA